MDMIRRKFGSRTLAAIFSASVFAGGSDAAEHSRRQVQ